MRRILGIGLAAVLLGSMVGSSAQAHTSTYKSKVVVDSIPVANTSGFAEGHVSSSRARCRVGRTVNIFFGSSTTPMTWDDTDVNGEWSAYSINYPPGEYRAVISGFTFKRSGGHRHRCRGDTAAFTVS